MQNKKVFMSDNKTWVIVCSAALICGLISFFVTVSLYDNFVVEEPQIALNDSKIKEYSLNEELVHESNISKEDDVSLITEDVAFTDEPSDEEELKVEEIDENNYEDFMMMLLDNNNGVQSEEIVEVSSLNVVEEVQENCDNVEFDMPISGEIGLIYAENELIYSKTLDEWTTHTGIDILGDEAEPIKAIADGIVEGIKMDPRYGNTIIIKHNLGYTSIYSNLSTTDLVYVGKNVTKGEIISGVGSGFGFECEEGPHIHLEILKDGDLINPFEVIEL